MILTLLLAALAGASITLVLIVTPQLIAIQREVRRRAALTAMQRAVEDAGAAFARVAAAFTTLGGVYAAAFTPVLEQLVLALNTTQSLDRIEPEETAS